MKPGIGPGRAAWIALLFAPTLGCGTDEPVPGPGDPAPKEVWFEEVSSARGLDFQHVSGHREAHAMPEIMGGGVALFDLEGDGDLDVYLVQSGDWRGSNPHGNALFVNDGLGNFASSPGGDAEDLGYGMGVAAGDVDGDGRTDLYVTNVGPDLLLLNDGAGSLSNRTAERGLGHSGWGASAALFDADRDGDLDLYVTTYLDWRPEAEIPCYNSMSGPDYCSPRSYDAPAVDVFYRNSGAGAFLDETEASGIGQLAGTGLGVACADFDGDGYEDVFVANDGMADRLWHNGGAGRFEDVAAIAGCATDENGLFKAGMGVTVADVDGDLDLDLLVCNLSRESDSFYVNEEGSFRDRTARGGLAIESRPFTRFGMGWVDFDQDGTLDLYQVNGRVMRHSRAYSEDPYAEPNLLQRGVSPGRFAPVSTSDGTAEPQVWTSRGAAFGDLDGDGGVDVVVVNRDGPARLYRNTAARGHWVRVRLVDPKGADALGATLFLEVGERRVRADSRSAYSYLSSSDPAVHVGLGSATEASSVRVRWIDGFEETFADLAADRTHTLQRGAGTPQD